MPFFSIIIPTYNRAERIEKTIQSVLDQQFTDFEIIVVDDGSTDETKEIIQAIKDDRIHYIYQKNGERGKARNNGTRNANGDYVFFLDSDDLLYPNHLALGYQSLTELKFPSFFHIRYEYVQGQHKIQVPLLNRATIDTKIRKQNFFACQFFLKRETALKFPFSEDRQLKIGEDWEVILKIAVRFPLHFTNEVQAAIVQHDDRSMQVADYEEILQSKDVLTEQLRMDKMIPKEVIENVSTELTTLAALAAAMRNQKRIALKLWWNGIKKNPAHLFKRRTLAIFKKIILNGAA